MTKSFLVLTAILTVAPAARADSEVTGVEDPTTEAVKRLSPSPESWCRRANRPKSARK